MTEPVSPDAAQNAPEAPQQQPETQDASALPEWARQSLTKANQEAAKYRTQVNELKPMADQFRALEESTKSETQRFAEAAEAAKRDAENARAEAIRYKAAATHGISADHFDLLGSGTEEEVTARAQKIAALISAQSQPAPPPATAPQRRPVEQLRPGATPGGVESEDDVLFAQLFGTK
jgi:hypothetical protein